MGQWSIPMQALAEKAGENAEAVIRKVTLDVFKAVVLKSPVDTGRFRANWNASLGTPDYSFTDSVQRNRGLAEAVRASTLPLGDTVYLSNGLPYARRLEDGYSQQAPVGMIRTTVAEVSAFLARATR